MTAVYSADDAENTKGQTENETQRIDEEVMQGKIAEKTEGKIGPQADIEHADEGENRAAS